MKKLFLIDYENAHWCGGQLNVVVWAYDEEDARDVAEEHMDQEQRELFYDEYEEEPDAEIECSYTVNSVEEFGPEHDIWQYYQMPDQRDAFYPTIGSPD